MKARSSFRVRRDGASSAVTTSSGMSSRPGTTALPSGVWAGVAGSSSEAGSGLGTPPPLVWGPPVPSGLEERTEKKRRAAQTETATAHDSPKG